MAGTCVPQPLVLPLQDVQVNATVADSFMTGIPAQVGTPPQDIVLLPWPFVFFSRLISRIMSLILD